MEKDAFLLERYKYILDQKKNLNLNTFKIISYYQVFMAGIAIGQFHLIKDSESNGIGEKIAVLGSWGLFALATMVSLVCCLMIFSGIASWIDYRRDEADIEAGKLGSGRKAPDLADALSWYETYILALIICVNVGYFFAMRFWIIPVIQ